MNLTAYYLNGSLFSLVPAHLRADFRWMADHGTTAVAISAYERDLGRSHLWHLFATEAHAAGLKLYIVPSRWAGLVAGWPGAPSRFCATRPDVVLRNAQGQPHIEGCWGLMASVHHPDTEKFYQECLRTVLQFDIDGIVWDEVKSLHLRDHHPLALQALGPNAPQERHIDAVADFFQRVTAYARTLRAGLQTTLFLYGNLQDYAVTRFAQIAALDYFGCDGRPFNREDAQSVIGLEGSLNLLLPHGQRFLTAARAQGKGGFLLIENMGLPATAIAVVDRRMPEVLAMRAEHLAYYYYGADCEEPEWMMAVMGKHLRGLKTK
jgi:hypothetical protein